jgi:hypothetical protein
MLITIDVDDADGEEIGFEKHFGQSRFSLVDFDYRSVMAFQYVLESLTVAARRLAYPFNDSGIRNCRRYVDNEHKLKSAEH